MLREMMYRGVVIFFFFLLSMPGYAELVSEWKFDGNVKDSKGNNHGTLCGDPTWTSDRYDKVGKALAFDGIDDYVDCGSDNSLKPVSAITIAAWVKFNSVSGDQMIVSYHNSTDSGYALYKLNDNILVAFFGYSPSWLLDNLVYNTSSFLAENTWYHFCVTFDGNTSDGNTSSFYINGFKVVSYSKTTSISYTGCDICRIGARKDIGSPYNYKAYFNGAIDEVRIYNHALTAAEVETLYDEQKP